MRTIALVGDSHLAAMKHGADRDPERYEGVHFFPLGKGNEVVAPFFRVENGSVFTQAETWKERRFPVPALSDAHNVLYAVSLALNTSRVLRDFSWDTHVPWSLKTGPDEQPVSDQLIDRVIDQDSRYAIGFIKALAGIGLDVCALEAPRFFENAPQLDRMRLDVCRYVSERYIARVSHTLTRAGIPIIRQPDQTISEQGTTRIEFDHENPKDAHHANADYGQLVLDEVLRFAESL